MVRLGALICFLVFVFSISAVDASQKSQYSFLLKDQVYANNLEYVGAVSSIQAGETFFGNLFEPTFRISFLPDQYFLAGVIMRMPFGASKIIDPISPRLAMDLHFVDDQLNIIAGSLNTNHRMIEALNDNILFYERPAEYGLQVISDFKYLEGEVWMNWVRAETAVHNEKFDTGLLVKFKWLGLFADAALHISHMGGQQFDNDDPVQDDNALAFGGGYEMEIPYLEHIEVGARRLFSKFTIRGRRQNLGVGSEARISVKPKGWQLSASYWKGSGFFHQNGDPLYQADTYYQVGLKKVFQPFKYVEIELDGRLRGVNGNIVHSEALLFSWNFEQTL